jgi:glyoxylase-like metal-dependent hydrolase (beta-lactamase superfamily II)
MEIIPGLWMIEGPGPCYLYRDADGYTLIDTGITGDATRILDYLGTIGGKPEQLKQIILTHSHDDHRGGHAELIERTEAQVLAHELDVPVIIGDAEFQLPDVPENERPFMEKAIDETPLALPARVDRALQDGDEIELGAGARAVHVPGHTPGSLAICLPKEKLLFAGDAAERDLEGNAILGMFNLDQAQAIRSFRKLAALDFEIACLGHGKPLDKDASLAFRQVANKL